MTVQPTRDQLLDMTERLGFLGDRPELCDEVVDGLWAALDRAEHRIARLEAQADIRGRAVVMYRERAREAEARVKAVRAIHRDLYESMSGVPYCDECDRAWPCPTIRALDGDA